MVRPKVFSKEQAYERTKASKRRYWTKNKEKFNFQRRLGAQAYKALNDNHLQSGGNGECPGLGDANFFMGQGQTCTTLSNTEEPKLDQASCVGQGEGTVLHGSGVPT